MLIAVVLLLGGLNLMAFSIWWMCGGDENITFTFAQVPFFVSLGALLLGSVWLICAWAWWRGRWRLAGALTTGGVIALLIASVFAPG